MSQNAEELPMDVQATLDQLVTLPVSDRIRLVQALWDSIVVEEPPAPLTDEQRATFARRTAELQENPGIGLTWEQIKARVKGEQ
jgi:putative addiction module component (TIGR02574 family)